MRKTQALERNGEPDDVAVPRQASFGVPYRIEAEVVALTFGIDGVLLNSQRVRKIVVGAMLVVERVQEDSDAIVLVQILALREVRAHRTGRIFTLEHDVQVLLVVRKISGGLLAGGIAVAGNILAEVPDSQFGFTRTAINEIVQLRRARDARNSGKRNRLSGWRRLGASLRERRGRADAKHQAPKSEKSEQGPHVVLTV